MKYIRIEKCHFQLPDDFDGTIGDAMKLMAEYNSVRHDIPDDGTELHAMGMADRIDAWYFFLKNVSDGGKFTARMAIEKIDGDKVTDLMRWS